MPLSGLSSTDIQNNKENRQKFYAGLDELNQVYFDENNLFKSYFGKVYAEFSKEGHNEARFSFSRGGGIDAARLYLIANDILPMEDIFIDREYKGESLEELEHIEMVQNAKLEAGRKVVEFLDAHKDNDDYTTKYFNDMFLKAFPKIMTAFNEYAGAPYDDVTKGPDRNHLLAGRIGEFLVDLEQDLGDGKQRRLVMRNAIDDYNRTKDPDAERITEDSLTDNINSAKNEVNHLKYRTYVKYYLDAPEGELKKSALSNLISTTAIINYRDDILNKNMADGKKRQDSISYQESTHVEQSKGYMAAALYNTVISKIYEYCTEEEIENAIYNGKFKESCKIELTEEGTLKTLSCMGIKYNAVTEEYEALPGSNLSKMSKRDEMIKEIREIRKLHAPVIPDTQDCYVNLTGMTKAEYFKDTATFGFNMTRQTAINSLICKFITEKKMTLEQALDPSYMPDWKHEEAQRFRDLLKEPVPNDKTPEYQARLEKVGMYMAESYWGARDELEKALRIGTESDKLVNSPDLVFSTKEGRTGHAAGLILHDLFQELTKEKGRPFLSRMQGGDPNPIDELVNMGAGATYCMKNLGEVPELAENMLVSGSNEDIKKLFDKIIDTSLFKDFYRNRRDEIQKADKAKGVKTELNYKTFLKFEDLEKVDASTKLPGGITLLERMRQELVNRIPLEELAKAAISGKMLKSLKIERDGYELKSITMMGIRVEPNKRATYDNGSPLPHVMPEKTKEQYKETLRALIKDANATNHALVFNSTQNYKDFITSVKDLKKLVNDEKFDYIKVENALENVMPYIKGYQEDHRNTKLDNFQKERLAVMARFEDLYIASKNKEQELTFENTSKALQNLRDDRHALEKQIIDKTYPETDGRSKLNKLALESANRLYDIVLNKKQITPEMKDTVVNDLKTLSLNKIIASESKWINKEGAGTLTTTVSKNPNMLDNIIQSANIGYLANHEAFKNPTLENVERALHGDDIHHEVNKIVKEIGDKIKVEENKKRAAFLKARAEKEKAAMNKDAKANAGKNEDAKVKAPKANDGPKK